MERVIIKLKTTPWYRPNRSLWHRVSVDDFYYYTLQSRLRKREIMSMITSWLIENDMSYESGDLYLLMSPEDSAMLLVRFNHSAYESHW